MTEATNQQSALAVTKLIVNISPVANMYGQNNVLRSINFTNDAVRANAQAIQMEQIASQPLEEQSRIGITLQYFMNFLFNAFLNNWVELFELITCIIRKAKTPLNGGKCFRDHFLSSHLQKNGLFCRILDMLHKLLQQWLFLPLHQGIFLELFLHNSFWNARDFWQDYPGVFQELWKGVQLALINSFSCLCITLYDINKGFVKQVICKLLCLGILFTASGHASGIAHDLQRFFNSAGMASNVTSPGAYQDQSGGYYSGGGVVARTGARNAQLATVQMPGFRAGCGGIDLWMGGFSHISSGALVEMLRNIGSSAASYAFMLAVQTVSPQIYNIMNELNALANQINQTNINSCEAAATMLGGIWPKSDQSSKHLCQAMGSSMGAFSDWAAARQGCGAKGDRSSMLDRANNDPRYKDMLVGEFNLAWKAIQANAFLIADKQLAQLFLTLVGSIISVKHSDAYKVDILPGHSDREDVLNGLLNGGPTSVYRCDETDKCLHPTLQEISLPPNSALLKRTNLILESLIEKIYSDGAPTKEEQDFLNSTRLPIYKMLNVITAFRKGSAPLDIHHYAELIAIDILYKYVMEVIDIVHDSVAQLKSLTVDDVYVDRFLNQLRYARERITERRKSAYQQMDSTLAMIQSTQIIEKQLHVMMGSIANDYNWA